LKTVDFGFKSSSCVVVGTFNTFVIQPKLLVEMQLLCPDAPIKVQQDLSQPGMRLVAEGLRWIIRPDRIVIESEDAGEDCGTPLRVLLSHLVWTPVFAVGVNAKFQVAAADAFVSPQCMQLPEVPFTTLQRTSHFSIPRGAQVLNFQLSMSVRQPPASVDLALNVHSDIAANKASRSQHEMNRDARSACERFRSDLLEAVGVAKTLFPEARFTDANNHDF
jgi:hypothetical protein